MLILPITVHATGGGLRKNSIKTCPNGVTYGMHSDGHGGHPALLYKKSDKKNIYFVIVFTSSPGPKRIKLKHSIEPIKVRVSFVHNTPSKSKRRDLGSRPLEGIKINKEDKPLIESIKRKK